jgi:hypothetical protein
MEIHSSHTEFWEDTSVPVGEMSIWAGRYYKAQLEYVTTIFPGEDWSLSDWLESVHDPEA